MKITRIYTRNSLRNYDYILDFSDSGEGITFVVDPSDHKVLLERTRKIDFYLITHEHYDHIDGLSLLIQERGGRVIGPQSILGKLQKFDSQAKGVLDGEEIFINADFCCLCLYIPGHIPSHTGFVFKKGDQQIAAFLGDTLFNGGVGNTAHGSTDILYQTITEKILKLDDSVHFYPEHDYWKSNLEFTLSIDPDHAEAKRKLVDYEATTAIIDGDFPAVTLMEEKMFNLFLNTKSRHVQQLVAKKCGKEYLNEKECFIELRKLRDQW